MNHEELTEREKVLAAVLFAQSSYRWLKQQSEGKTTLSLEQFFISEMKIDFQDTAEYDGFVGVSEDVVATMFKGLTGEDLPE